MITLRDGGLRFTAIPFEHSLQLSYRHDGAWRVLPLLATGSALCGADALVQANLSIEAAGDHFEYALDFTSQHPTRLQLALLVPQASEVFHVIPGVLFGDNNLAHAEPGHYPNLTTQHAASPSCSPYWELRADRGSHPVSILYAKGCVAAISIDPYSEGRAQGPSADSFIRNGVFAQLAMDDMDDACGVTLGYGNLPRTFHKADSWLDSTAHFTTEATARGGIFLYEATSRRDVRRVIRHAYQTHRETPATPITQRDAVTALTDAFLNINYHDANGTNAAGTSGGRATAFFGGGGFRENFTNMRCVDEPKQTLTAWRTLAEIGWSGGGVIASPLLMAGHALHRSTAIARAMAVLDSISNAFNPTSGLLYDVSGKHEGQRLNWWWSGYLVQDCHCAYTNGSGIYHLLKSYLFARDVMQLDSNRIEKWLETSLRALDTMLKLQLPDGNYGFSYSAERLETLDVEGFAGAWFIPAMALAYRCSGKPEYLASARRGLEFYHGYVRDLECWGTPLDTWKAPDHEGNLAFLRGAQLLHEMTGDRQYLEALEDSAEYEYLWRIGFRARPQYAPLKDSHWNSCGGSLTSVAASIHPMGVFVSRELRYLAQQTNDDYHAARCEDGINWGINSVSLYPDVTGYGARGVMTERFCASDGMAIETFPDGSPSSIWFSYNGWAAGAVLEGLIETLECLEEETLTAFNEPVLCPVLSLLRLHLPGVLLLRFLN